MAPLLAATNGPEAEVVPQGNTCGKGESQVPVSMDFSEGLWQAKRAASWGRVAVG